MSCWSCESSSVNGTSSEVPAICWATSSEPVPVAASIGCSCGSGIGALARPGSGSVNVCQSLCYSGPMASPGATRPAARREREHEIVEATRRLFDERGLQDAPIEEIARAAGINRALIYRHFSSKEELFVATVTSYLAELNV